MAQYSEIEDPKEILQLNKKLSAKLRQLLKYEQIQTIGYPRGRFDAKVRFSSKLDPNAFWWGGTISDDGEVANNFFGHGTSGQNGYLNIDVQFNLPIVNFSRRSGGSFLRHLSTGTIVLAHRGIVTLGHGRVQRSMLFAEMAATLSQADTSNGQHDFLLITELDSETLVKDISEFAAELRRTVKAIKERMDRDEDVSTLGRKKAQKPVIKGMGKLRAYFDEFSGKKKVNGRKTIIADCYHGAVVRALRDELVAASFEVMKTVEIDLVAIKPTKTFLFEVKTSADTQSVYTAVGQLMVHSPRVLQEIPGASVKNVILLPSEPSESLSKILTENLALHLLTYDRAATGHISINGLQKLL